MITLLLVCAVGPFVRPVDAFGDPLPLHAVARLGTERFRLENWAHAADVTPDGKIIAATDGRAVTLFDAATGQRLGHLDRAGGIGLRFSADGQRLVAWGDALTVIDVGKRALELTLEDLHDSAREVGISGDGRHVAYAKRGKGGTQIEVYSIPTRKVVRTFDLPGSPRLVLLALSAKADRLVAAIEPRSGERTLKLWDVTTGKELPAPKVAAQPAAALTFSPDGKTLAVAGSGDRSVLWALDRNQRLAPLGKDRGAAAVTFSRDAKRVAVTGRDGTSLYDARTGTRVSHADFPAGTHPTGVRVLPGATAVAVGVASHAVRVVPAVGLPDRTGHAGPVRSVAFAADGRTLHSSAVDGVRSWETAGWRPTAHVEVESGAGRRYMYFGTTFLSPSGRLAFTMGDYSSMRVDDLATGKKLGTIGGRWQDGPVAPSLSADETRAAFVGTVNDPDLGEVQRVLVVELPSLEHVKWIPLPFKRGQHSEVALSPDGTRVVAASGGLALLFDVAAGRERGRVRLPGAASRPVFSPDGRWLALPAAGEVRVTDAATLDTVVSQPLPRDRAARLVAFSPDSRLLAVARERAHQPGSSAAEVAVYELASRKERWTYPGRAQALAFSADGKRLAAGVGCTAVVYDLSGLSLLRPPERPLDRWAALEGDATAAAAMASLSLDPAGAVALIGAKLQPAEGKGLPLRLAKRLVEELRDPEKRARAELLLEGTGPRLIGLLADMGLESDHPDAKLSLRGLVREAKAWPGEGMLRPVRAIEVLERLATPEARRLLEGLAAGNPDSRLTVEAQAALRRMRR